MKLTDRQLEFLKIELTKENIQFGSVQSFVDADPKAVFELCNHIMGEENPMMDLVPLYTEEPSETEISFKHLPGRREYTAEYIYYSLYPVIYPEFFAEIETNDDIKATEILPVETETQYEDWTKLDSTQQLNKIHFILVKFSSAFTQLVLELCGIEICNAIYFEEGETVDMEPINQKITALQLVAVQLEQIQLAISPNEDMHSSFRDKQFHLRMARDDLSLSRENTLSFYISPYKPG